MTSDAPILAASADGREQADPRRWAALTVLLLAALQCTLWYQVGAFLLAFLLMLALPRRAARSVHGTEPVHDTQALPAKG
jgi:hypothetical protein